MKRSLMLGMAGLGLLAGVLGGTYAGTIAATDPPVVDVAGPLYVDPTYVCIEGGDGMPGWACYLRGDAPAVEPGQDYVVTDEPTSLPVLVPAPQTSDPYPGQPVDQTYTY